MRFPATLFHELAHFLAAALLGARPSRLSLVPRRLPADRMEMGAVTFEAHWSTAGLVALAPLVAGLATMALSWQLALEGDSAAYGAWFALGTVAGRPSVVDWALAVRYPLSGLLGLAACALVLVFGFQPP